MWFLPLLFHFAHADASLDADKIETTRASISEDEKRSREALSHLFVINKSIKDTARKQEELNKKLFAQEASVRGLAQEVQKLESRTDQHKEMLNKRLRQLYQERDSDDFHWLFSASSPVELERNHRFLKLMIDSDHRQLKEYIDHLTVLRKKRTDLKAMVARLAGLQKQMAAQEEELGRQLHLKSKLLADLKKSKDLKISELKSLRRNHVELNDVLSYAFFERKGNLRAPIDGRVAREYGTYVDPQFHFRVMHKGLFYSALRATEVHAVARGRVVFASQMAGMGKAVIVDHGDNYYSVYAFASQIKVHEGDEVHEGDLIARSGRSSPLFGPGLYFEIRHFTDAIDPRPWIKDSVVRTAAE